MAYSIFKQMKVLDKGTLQHGQYPDAYLYFETFALKNAFAGFVLKSLEHVETVTDGEGNTTLVIEQAIMPRKDLDILVKFLRGLELTAERVKLNKERGTPEDFPIDILLQKLQILKDNHLL